MADDDVSGLHDIETPFDRRVSKLTDAETMPFELVACLGERDLPMPTSDRKSRSLYPLAALVRVFLFHKLSGKPIDGILDRLKENSDEAAAFGDRCKVLQVHHAERRRPALPHSARGASEAEGCASRDPRP